MIKYKPTGQEVIVDRKLFIETALNFWRRGAFYSWGGDDPDRIDCSGLVMECAKTVGIYPRKSDRTARGIYADAVSVGLSFSDVPLRRPGCMIFWGPRDMPNNIYHVEIYIGDGRTVGASGGGSNTNTHADAIRDNAFVKVRPVRNAKDGEQLFFADPFNREFPSG